MALCYEDNLFSNVNDILFKLQKSYLIEKLTRVEKKKKNVSERWYVENF